jgi:ADP-heptose:LPS heptosyltransferase
MRLRLQKAIDHRLGLFLFFWIRPISLLLGKIMRRDHSLEVREQIVVMKLLGGGSLFVALPTLKAIRDRYPDKRITLVCTPGVRAYGELTGVFDDFAVIDTRSMWSTIWSGLGSLRKSFRADIHINFEIHSKMAGLFSLFTCARNRIGFYMQWNAWKHGVTTHALFYNEITPIYVAYEQIIALLGATKPSDREIEDHLLSANAWAGRVAMNEDGCEPRNVAIAAFSSELCPEREFSPGEWRRLLGQLFASKKPTLHLLGGPADKSKSTELACTLREADFEVVEHTGQLSLRDSVAKMLVCDELLTIDSGLNHIARRLRLPIRSYWGPTHPRRLLAPVLGLREEICAADVFCSPCVHIIDRPPCMGDNVCMKSHVGAALKRVNDRGWLVHLSFRDRGHGRSPG